MKPTSFIISALVIWMSFSSFAENRGIETINSQLVTGKKLTEIFDYDSCSFYCAAWPEFESSSHLIEQGNNKYAAENIHDGKFDTAWIEGVKGNGEGESVTYILDLSKYKPNPNGPHPKIDGLSILNGYTKDHEIWKNYGRVKSMRVLVSGKPYCIVNLLDTPEPQTVAFTPISILRGKTTTLKLEIMSVYPGEKYSDTALTEVRLNGTAPH